MLAPIIVSVLGAWVDNPNSLSSSGSLFRAVRGRSYSGAQLFSSSEKVQAVTEQHAHAHASASSSECKQWAVTTTIFLPSKAVLQVDGLKDW